LNSATIHSTIALVDIVAAQVRVAVGGLHFDHAFAHFEDGNIERAAAQVVHGDGFVFLLVQSVGQRGRRRLVNDAQNFEARDFAGLFGGLALAVVEIGRDGDHGFGYLFAEEIFRGSLQLLQNHRRDFRRAVDLAGNFDAGVVVRSFDHLVRDALGFFLHFVVAAAHKALDRIHSVFGIGDRWRLATWPTRRSPLLVMPTTDGVVRAPSWLGLPSARPPALRPRPNWSCPGQYR
jgi:hypothetical protein